VKFLVRIAPSNPLYVSHNRLNLSRPSASCSTRPWSCAPVAASGSEARGL